MYSNNNLDLVQEYLNHYDFTKIFFMISYLLVLALLSSTVLGHTLELIKISDPDAFCLDGTKPAYYVHKGDPQKFILSF